VPCPCKLTIAARLYGIFALLATATVPVRGIAAA
jgi:hypothetical protein